MTEEEEKQLERKKRRERRAERKTGKTEDSEQLNPEDYEKKIKQLTRELKRAERAAKSGETFEKELLAQRKEFDDITDTNMVYAITDKSLMVTQVSRAFSDMFGYPKDKILNNKYSILIHNESHEKFYNGCEYVSSHGKESWGTDFVMQKDDATVLYTHTFIYPLFESGVLNGFMFVSNDISTKRMLYKLQVKLLSNEKNNPSTIDFISSTSAAVLDTISYKVSAVVKLVVTFVILFLIYAVTFNIDELARGSGKFIPTSKVQHIKNQEGGIIESLYVHDGDNVKKGQILLKLSDISYQVKLDENYISIMELKAKQARLKAESLGLPMEEISCGDNCDKRLIDREKKFFLSNQKELSKNIGKQKEQLKSKYSNLEDAKNKYAILDENYQMLKDELDIKKALEKDKIFTKYELTKLERELNDLSSSKRSAEESIVQINAQIKEIGSSIEEAVLISKNKASEQYNSTSAEILRLKESRKNLEDIKKRTIIRSPVDGVVNELFVHTIGTSVPASFELLTIIPNNQNMLAEIQMSPTQIAKLHIGQDVRLKVTAYDYSVYGGLDGKIVNITPDTILDKVTQENNYLVYVKTRKNYLNNNRKYKIKVGMIVNADIIVGKKTIMAFLLKPILKTTQRD
ncbi:MAG: HlyD family type I secretion periplasmic adaptor subunit [Campylobacterota bacterium]|nr:HlyD family type I secretion periplasmic adaptor subunit [Campylobacterota bacterium]